MAAEADPLAGVGFGNGEVKAIRLPYISLNQNQEKASKMNILRIITISASSNPLNRGIRITLVSIHILSLWIQRLIMA